MPSTTMGIPYPASTDDVQLWPKFQAQAVAVDTLLNLPDETNGSTSGGVNISAGAGTFGSIGISAAITNPSSVYKMIVDVQFNTFLQLTGTGFVHVGVAASGGMTFAANAYGSGGAIQQGDNIILPAPASGTGMGQISVEIPAGAATVTFTIWAMRTVADGVKGVNTSVIRVKPRRFKL